MEREYVRVRRLDVADVHTVQNGMRGFVSDDVVSQASEDDATGVLRSWISVARREVTEKNGPLLRRVVGVLLPQGVGIEAQVLDELIGTILGAAPLGFDEVGVVFVVAARIPGT